MALNGVTTADARYLCCSWASCCGRITRWHHAADSVLLLWEVFSDIHVLLHTHWQQQTEWRRRVLSVVTSWHVSHSQCERCVVVTELVDCWSCSAAFKVIKHRWQGCDCSVWPSSLLPVTVVLVGCCTSTRLYKTGAVIVAQPEAVCVGWSSICNMLKRFLMLKEF